MIRPRLRREHHYGHRFVSAYVDRPATVWDMFLDAVRSSPEAEALVEGELRLTYRQLDERVRRLIAGLSSRGLRHGDRLALLLGNKAEFVEALLASAGLGVAVVPIGTRLQKDEVTYICAHSGASAVIFEARFSSALPDPAAAPDLHLRISIDDPVAGSAPYADLLRDVLAGDPPGLHEDDLLLIAYTSGTTGRPKGAMISHVGAVHGCLNWRYGVGADGPQSTILAIPAAHIGGTAGVILPMILCAGKLVLMPEFRAKPFLDLALRERMTYAVLVPAIYNLCLLEPTFGEADLGQWRWGVCSGAPMPEAILSRFRERLPGLNLLNAYGATETTSAISCMPVDRRFDHPGSVGLVVPCGDIAVVADDGTEAQPGEPGELWIRGPMVVAGYWRDERATQEAFCDGFWKSGDIGSVSPDGFVRVLDRKKDMINRGGMKVFAAEVESALSQHPDIIESAVIAKPDEVLGERIRAVIVPRVPLETERVRAFCRGRLADYKVPEIIEFRAEPLPRNANGKILKRLLVGT